MNDITIRNLDHASVQRLRQLAWQDGRPLEDIIRELLLAAPELRAVTLNPLSSDDLSSETPDLIRSPALDAGDPKRKPDPPPDTD